MEQQRTAAQSPDSDLQALETRCRQLEREQAALVEAVLEAQQVLFTAVNHVSRIIQALGLRRVGQDGLQ